MRLRGNSPVGTRFTRSPIEDETRVTSGTRWNASLPGHLTRLPVKFRNSRFHPRVWFNGSKLKAASPRREQVALQAFTMIEIAISLGVIGFALVAIIGIMPAAMQTQKENRQETIITQDATVFMNAIRNGERGIDDLTNYVVAISNYSGTINNNGSIT